MRGFFVVLCFIAASGFVSAQVDDSDAEETRAGNTRKEEFWISVSAETAMYNISSPVLGPSLAVAYGRGISVGIKAGYFAGMSADRELSTDVLELCFLLRFYFRGLDEYSGPFVQLDAGHAVFFRRENGFSLPAQWGIISAGINAGWRFTIGKRFYVEPYVRGGFPYFFGGGLGVGVRTESR